MPEGLIIQDPSVPMFRGFGMGLQLGSLYDDRYNRDRAHELAIDEGERRDRGYDLEEDRIGNEAARIQQREDENAEEDRLRSASQAANTDVYSREVLAPQMWDVGDGQDMGGTVDNIGSLLQAKELFGAADPQTQHQIMGPALQQQRMLVRQKNTSALKYQYDQTKMQERIKAVLASDAPPEEKERAIMRIQSEVPFDLTPDDTLSDEEWGGMPARGLLSPDVQLIADSYVQATGKFPPMGTFNTVTNPKAAGTNALRLTPGANVNIYASKNAVRIAASALRLAEKMAWMTGDTEPFVQAQDDLKSAILADSRIAGEEALKLQTVQAQPPAANPAAAQPGATNTQQPQPGVGAPAAAPVAPPVRQNEIPGQAAPPAGIAAPPPAAAPAPAAAVMPPPIAVPPAAAAPPAAPSPAAPVQPAPPVPSGEAQDDMGQLGQDDPEATAQMEATRAMVAPAKDLFKRRFGRDPGPDDKVRLKDILRALVNKRAELLNKKGGA